MTLLILLSWNGHFGGLGHFGLVQSAAALLVVLGKEISLLRRYLAFEHRQGDVHGPADFFGLGETEAHPEDQRQVQQRGDEQGKAKAVRRTDAGRGKIGGEIGGKRHR